MAGYFRVDSTVIFRPPLFLDIFVICWGNSLCLWQTYQVNLGLLSSVLYSCPLFVTVFWILLAVTFFFNYWGKKKTLFFFKEASRRDINFEAALNDSPKWQRLTLPLNSREGDEQQETGDGGGGGWEKGRNKNLPKLRECDTDDWITDFRKRCGCECIFFYIFK